MGPRTPTNEGPQLRWRYLIEQGRLFERGYALVQVDLRGYGGSDGCNDLGGAGEQADVERAVRWAAIAVDPATMRAATVSAQLPPALRPAPPRAAAAAARRRSARSGR